MVAKVGDDVIEGLFVGSSRLKPNYRAIADLFFEEELSQANIIHHAIEQQVRKRFPDLFKLEEIHAGENLRAILRGAFNSEVHLSRIRILWNSFYELLEGTEGLSRGASRRAFYSFRKYVDGYIEAITEFMETNRAAVRAANEGDTRKRCARFCQPNQTGCSNGRRPQQKEPSIQPQEPPYRASAVAGGSKLR